MKKYIIAIYTLLSLSCNDKPNLMHYIYGDEIKYWEQIDSVGKINGCFSFSKDGECVAYYYNERENCKRYKSFDDDVIYENNWVLKNDTILRFKSIDNKILILNNDSILTEHNGFKRLLIKSKCQEKNPKNCNELDNL